jgi:hypothetical protein
MIQMMIWLLLQWLTIQIGSFATCLDAGGPNVSASADCACFDHDGDGSVTLRDWAAYSRCVRPSQCTIADDGTIIRMCQIAETAGGSLWEFPRAILNIYVLVEGPELRLRFWTDRDLIGDADAAVLFPHDGPTSGRYGVGVCLSPNGIVAMEIVGVPVSVRAVEDVIYAGE